MIDWLNWHVRFQTFKPIPALPQPVVVACESRRDTSYHLVGRLRTDAHLVFQYSLSGTGVYEDSTGRYEMPAGSGFLCPTADRDVEYYYPQGAAHTWKFMYFSFIGETAMQMVRQVTRQYGPVFRIPQSNEMINRLLSFEAMDEVIQPISAGAGAKLVMDVIAALIESAGPRDAADSAGVLVRRALKLIEDNLTIPLSVGDIADELRISREHLTRIFSEQTGRSPYSYILRRKMLLACRLLKQTTLTMGEIADRLGYVESSRFTRSFKTGIGMTPSRFRKDGQIPFA